MKAVELPLTNSKRLFLWLASGILAPIVLTLATAGMMEQKRRSECGDGLADHDVQHAFLANMRVMVATLFG
eukprot:12672522-Alexandrium_andersonii.AAC.1